MKRARILFFTFLTLIVNTTLANNSIPFSQRTDVNEFIKQLVQKDKFQEKRLISIFNQVTENPEILAMMTSPAEGKPWHSYRKIFMNPKRIDLGVKFWEQHKKSLDRAEKEYGVPAPVIIAIIGVESYYGQHQGRFSVLDALSTLAFDYPPRAPFFRKELEEFLLLAREQGFKETEIKGSYAGAMGFPQFMPSSYRNYAVDFTGNGQRDLLNTPEDVIGSVANYLKQQGWKREQPVADPIKNLNLTFETLSKDGKYPLLSVAEYEKYGIKPLQKVSGNEKATLREFNLESSPDYWLTFENFAVIMRYNISANYAMAVYQLSEEIKNERIASLKVTNIKIANKVTTTPSSRAPLSSG